MTWPAALGRSGASPTSLSALGGKLSKQTHTPGTGPPQFTKQVRGGKPNFKYVREIFMYIKVQIGI